MPTLTSYVDSTIKPTSISGLALWLDAADASSITLNGTSVTQWKDKSTFAANVSQATLINMPQYIYNEVNNNNIIRFNAANSTSLNNSITNLNLTTGPATFILVEKNLTGLQGAAPYSFSSGPNGGIIFQSNLGLQPFGSGATYTSTTARIDIFYRKNTTGINASSGYVNGTYTSPYQDNATGTYSAGIYVGVRQNGLIYTSGDIMEIIIYANELTTTERQQIEGYLAWKWNIQSSLPANHPYKNAPYGTNYGSGMKLYTDSTIKPTSISGLALWLDAADASTFSFSSGSNISQWRDKSSSGINMAYDTGTVVYNTTGFNNSPTIALGPGKSGLTYNSPVNLSATASLSFYIVLKSTTSSGNSRILSFFNSTDYTPPGFNICLYSANKNIGVNRGNPYASYNNTNISNVNTFTSIIFNADLTTNPAIPISNTGISINGGTFTNFANNYSIGTAFSTYNPFKIGEWSGIGTDIFVGNISEIIMYNRALNATENSQIEGYLAWKWNLASSLPANHPYKNAPYGTNYGSTMKSTPF